MRCIVASRIGCSGRFASRPASVVASRIGSRCAFAGTATSASCRR